jgi:hypothetical protein
MQSKPTGLEAGRLLIDVTVTLLFSTILENHDYAQEQNNVKRNDAKRSCEDEAEVGVGIGRECADTAFHGRSNARVGTCVADNEWRRE